MTKLEKQVRRFKAQLKKGKCPKWKNQGVKTL